MIRLLLFLVGIFFVILFPIYAIIKVFSSDISSTNKLLWFIVILFFPFFGALVYFIFGKKDNY
jgi:hypothetical protein